MASATASPSSISCFLPHSLSSPPSSSLGRPVVGLPSLRRSQISCSYKSEEKKQAITSPVAPAIVAAAFAAAQPALALVDERLSTEGTNLSLGISNPLLIWIIVGVFGLIWALFFVYSSSLPEGDDDSGLAL